MRLAIAIFGCALILTPHAAMAAQGDVETIASCVSATETPAACIGKIATPCQAEPEGQTSEGSLACVNRERDAWDAILNERYEAELAASAEIDTELTSMPGGNFEPVAETLKLAQRAWLDYRDAECLRRYNLFQSGSYRFDAEAACQMELTATRALDISASQD